MALYLIKKVKLSIITKRKNAIIIFQHDILMAH